MTILSLLLCLATLGPFTPYRPPPPPPVEVEVSVQEAIARLKSGVVRCARLDLEAEGITLMIFDIDRQSGDHLSLLYEARVEIAMEAGDLLPSPAMNEALFKIRYLIASGVAYRPSRYCAVAHKPYSSARNREQFFYALRQRFNIPVELAPDSSCTEAKEAE